MTPIRADLLAAKFKAAHTAEAPEFAEQLKKQPRYAELLWFLQWASFQLFDGLEKLVARLIELFPERFQTRAMIAAGAPDKSGRYSLSQCLEVWKADAQAENIRLSYEDRFVGRGVDEKLEKVEELSYHDFLLYFVEPTTTLADAKGESRQAVAIRSAFERFNFEYLKKSCLRAAKWNLPDYLSALCEPHSSNATRALYCPDLIETLFAFMDHHAREAAGQIAETVITKAVFRELKYALESRKSVALVGESRFGKTKAVSTFCEMFPGRARLVTVPESNREADLTRAHADAFGIDYTPGAPNPALKDKVEFVLRHAGVMIVYDESHFLVPISYHKNTPPRRLDWVRNKVVDRGVPCAFFATPQSYDQTLEQYVKTTSYRLEQWVGRIAPTVILSDVIPVEEVVAVARKNFPELTEDQLQEIADRAILSDGYLKSIELSGSRALFIARERGHAKPSTKDVVDACNEMMPTEPRIVTSATLPEKQPVRRPSAPALQPRGSRTAELDSEPGKDEFPRRQIAPSRRDLEAVSTA